MDWLKISINEENREGFYDIFFEKAAFSPNYRQSVFVCGLIAVTWRIFLRILDKNGCGFIKHRIGYQTFAFSRVRTVQEHLTPSINYILR
jgi:hypothetical protein